MLAHQRASGSAGKLANLEGVRAQQFQRLIEVRMGGLLLHRFSLSWKNRV
jgi:hypothetical protein